MRALPLLAMLLLPATALAVSGHGSTVPFPHGEVPEASPSPTAGAKPKPTVAPGTMTLETLPGGWLDSFAGETMHLQLSVAGISFAANRALLLTQASTDDYSKLLLSRASLIGADGKALREVSLPGDRPITADLSPDGKLGVVVAEPYASGGEMKGTLYAFDDGGHKLWKKDVALGQELLVGNGFVALFKPPALPAAWEAGDEETPPPGQVAEVASFYKSDGTLLRPGSPVGGALAKAGDGLVAVAEGKLSILDGRLIRHAQVDLGFKIGMPVASADGSTIAVADFTDEGAPDPSAPAKAAPQRDLALFDRAGKKTGLITMRAMTGIDATVSADGSALLATPATLEVGPRTVVDDTREMTLIAADRTGKVRWRWVQDRKTPSQHLCCLSIADGGKRAVVGIVGAQPPEGDEGADDEEKPPEPDEIVMFDGDGKVVYRTEGEFQDVWLDPTGSWLYTVEPAAFSRLDVQKVIAGTAFPEPKQEPGDATGGDGGDDSP